VKHPMTPEEYNQMLCILQEHGLLNSLVPLVWDQLRADEQQGLFEVFEYAVMPYEKDFVALAVHGATDE
jgi:hypothetical protein